MRRLYNRFEQELKLNKFNDGGVRCKVVIIDIV